MYIANSSIDTEIQFHCVTGMELFSNFENENHKLLVSSNRRRQADEQHKVRQVKRFSWGGINDGS